MGKRESLNAYIRSVNNKPFEWGKHDCLTFTNGAYRAMYGEGWAEDWLNRYMKNSTLLKRDGLRKEYGFSSFTSAVDKKLTRIDYIPPLGALVTTKKTRRWAIGVAMGICTGSKAVFLSEKGLLHLPLDYIYQSWIKI